MRRLVALAVALSVTLSACALLQPDRRTYRAMFSRAIQLFPGGTVRVLGVDVGQITDVRNTPEGVEVTFDVTEPDTQLPADVEAAIVPSALLGERYIQLFPAYEGGPALEPGGTIPLSRTAVPAEPDELLRSLQNYLGAIDPEVVGDFVDNAAAVLDGTGEELNSLIEHAAGVLGTLSDRRDDLAGIIVQFERLTGALSTRQAEIGRLIHTYNDVVGTVNANRAALEGTITGLNEMSVELAGLLVDHRDPLGEDIQTLTKTARTLDRNIQSFARTGKWARRLFSAASRAVDYDRNWLRLNNQGEPLEELIVQRLLERLTDLCENLGLPDCSSPAYWEARVPAMFCLEGRCPEEDGGSPTEQLTGAITEVPELADAMLERIRELSCESAPDPGACRERKEALLGCGDAANPRACLRRHGVPKRCLEAANVSACIDRARSRAVRGAVDDLLKGTLDGPLGVGGAL